ncbi:hypothetical protein PV_023 (endogenous virus) [Gutovirus Vc1]|uniref:Uncharacterized protein n=1 Tax=Vibrio phage Vc1 TaxID=1480731 RepID=X2L0C8_9CAUD|nr:hypothetical protein HOQ97_gp23 [Vibrio phage Vc1]AHN84674.1 hypothetical protein PV_023 [Vibrio phage Vc1]
MGLVNLTDVEVKEFKCHKHVHAASMTAGEYWERKGVDAPLPKETEGYLVIYSLGKEDEYVSWSPSKAFEEGYTEV